MGRSDPLINYLRDLNFHAVRLPSSDIHPRQVFAQMDNRMQQIGELAQLFVVSAGKELPQLKENAPNPDITGKHSSEIKAELGVSILGNIIQAMGGDKLKVEAKYQNAETITFQFHNVLQDSIVWLVLDEYLTISKVNRDSYNANLLLQKHKIFVTTATIKSNEFSVEAKRSGGSSLELSVPIIKKIVGGDMKVSGNTGENSVKLTFKGHNPLTFGLQAVQLIPEQSHFRVRPAAIATVFDVETSHQKHPEYLKSEETFLDLDVAG